MPYPQPAEYPVFFDKYIQLVNASNYSEIYEKYYNYIIDFVSNLPAEKENFKYGDDKWTVKEVVQHITDTDRVFNYRTLRISRKDETNLASFNETKFAENAFLKNRSLVTVIEEFKTVFKASNLLFQNLSEEQFNFKGIVNNNSVNVNALVFMSYGHILHHINILKTKYLV